MPLSRKSALDAMAPRRSRHARVARWVTRQERSAAHLRAKRGRGMRIAELADCTGLSPRERGRGHVRGSDFSPAAVTSARCPGLGCALGPIRRDFSPTGTAT